MRDTDADPHRSPCAAPYRHAMLSDHHADAIDDVAADSEPPCYRDLYPHVHADPNGYTNQDPHANGNSMNLFTESFDNWATAAVAATGKWTSTADTGLAIDTVVPRTGLQDLKVTLAASSTECYLGKVLAAAGQRFYQGFALLVNTFDASNPVGLLQWYSGATKQITLELHPDGSLSVNSSNTGGTQLAATAAGIIVTGIYLYVELFVLFHQSSGFVMLNVNGVNLINLGGLNTDPAASGTGSQVRLGAFCGGATLTTTYHFDDFYLNNDVGPYNDGFEATLSETVRVYEFFPTANGTTVDFLPQPHSTPNWECVGGISALDDTAFVADNTVGDLDLYTYGALPATVTEVLAVQVSCIAKKAPATGNVSYENAFVAASNAVRSGEIEADGDGVNTTDSYAWYLNVLETDPNTLLPFETTSVNDMETGVKLVLNE